MKRGRGHVHSEAEAVRRHRVEGTFHLDAEAVRRHLVEGTFHLDADDYSEEDIDKCRVEGRACMRTPVFACARVFLGAHARLAVRVWPCAQLRVIVSARYCLRAFMPERVCAYTLITQSAHVHARV